MFHESARRLSSAIAIAIATAAAGCAAGAATSAAPEEPKPLPVENPAPPPLTYDVFVGDEPGFLVTSTLIMGAHDAILVDGQFTLSNGKRLADWIAQHGKQLKAIWITHAHPDHFFGLEPVLARFPGTPVLSTTQVVAAARESAPKKVEQWGPLYKDDLTRKPVIPQPYNEPTLSLDGQQLDIVRLAQADDAPATAIHIPTVGLLVAGDAVYSGVHVWLAEVPTMGLRKAWMTTLDELAALAPTHVVPGHMKPDAGTEAKSIQETRKYIELFSQTANGVTDPQVIIDRMKQAYPDYALPIVLELAAKATVANAH